MCFLHVCCKHRNTLPNCFIIIWALFSHLLVGLPIPSRNENSFNSFIHYWLIEFWVFLCVGQGGVNPRLEVPRLREWRAVVEGFVFLLFDIKYWDSVDVFYLNSNVKSWVLMKDLDLLFSLFLREERVFTCALGQADSFPQEGISRKSKRPNLKEKKGEFWSLFFFENNLVFFFFFQEGGKKSWYFFNL